MTDFAIICLIQNIDTWELGTNFLMFKILIKVSYIQSKDNGKYVCIKYKHLYDAD